MQASVSGVVATLLILAGACVAIAAPGDTNTMESACSNGTERMRQLCSTVKGALEYEQDQYVDLGAGYYLVAVSSAPRASQGFYVAEVNNRVIKQFGGYGLPEIVGVINRPGSLVVLTAQAGMSHGRYGRATSALHVRQNPVTNTPYLLEQELSVATDGSEELESYCRQPENSKRLECKDIGEWGRTKVLVSNEELKALKSGRISLDRLLLKRLRAAHKVALKVHDDIISKRVASYNVSVQPYKILENAGVLVITDRKPNDMALDEYVSILNDYAFLATDYLLGRRTLAVEILYKVIQLSPGRVAAYLNIADALDSEAKSPEMPLGSGEVEKLTKAATSFRATYERMNTKKANE